MTSFFQIAWGIVLSLAPWLLLGMLIAGLLHGLLPPGWIKKSLRGSRGVWRAVILGVPLPLCSCGVIPAALGLRKDGASRGATLGFLISTPQTGVDSLLVSAAFLGWPFAIFKVLSALATGALGGLLAEHLKTDPTPGDSPEQASRKVSAKDMVNHGLMVFRSIWRWIAMGILISAVIEVALPREFFEGLAAYGSVLPYLLALALSLPLYVCATASVPIAAALVHSGMPTGAALVFLMAGPATNLATIGAVFSSLGRRATVIYLGTIVGASIVLGYAFESILQGAHKAAPHSGSHHDSWATPFAAVFLLLLTWFALADLRAFLRHRKNKNTKPADCCHHS